MPQISFLILTYNSENYVDKILGSIISLCGEKFEKKEYELLVLDNNSSDNTRSLIERFTKKYSFINFVVSNENLGYAKGINKLASYAKGDLLLVINPDAELVKEDFKNLIQEFSQNPKLAIAGLKIIGSDGKNEDSAGKFYNPLSFLLFSLGMEKLVSQRFSPEKKRKVDYVSGGFVVFDSQKFKALKGYDEDYFMYIEDMDLCFRAKKLGLHVYFLPVATIRHQGQGSSNKTFAIVNIFKGLLIFSKKHHSKLFYLFVKYLLKLKAIFIIVIGTLTGREQIVITYKEAIKTIK